MDLVTQFSNPAEDHPIPVVPTIGTSFDLVRVPDSRCGMLTEAESVVIVERYLSGATLLELAGEYGVHKRTVADHLERRGVARRVNERQLSDRQVDQAKAMYSDFVSLSKIGARLGVDGSIVARELRKMGVSIRPQGVRY